MKLRDAPRGNCRTTPAQLLTKACLKSSLGNAFTTAAFCSLWNFLKVRTDNAGTGACAHEGNLGLLERS